MKRKVRVLRGEAWAKRLARALESPPLDPGEWMEQHTRILKAGHYTLSGLLRLGDDTCFLKLYRPRTTLQRLRYSMGIGRPQRKFIVTRNLVADGLAAPLPLASLRVPGGIFLLIEALPGDGNLAEMWQAPPDEATACAIMASAGETLATLHRFGYAHGDCKWGKLFWNGQRVHLVDLNDANKCKLGAPEKARDLARFTIDAEALRIGPRPYEHFIVAYAGGTGQTRRQTVERLLPYLYRFRSEHLGRTDQQLQRLV